jgi:tetrapyrrole methylase family protein/MazG family protein
MEDTELNRKDSFLDKLFRLVKTLRGKEGCPWDKKQTPQSVSVYLIEEVFELADAIQSGNPGQIREELGDVLFHVVFIAAMFEERGEFDLEDVAQAITEKMIRRHPHVFGNQKVNSSEEVVQNWQKIKLKEKGASQKHSILDSVPPKLPALLRAYRILDRAAKHGFEWTDTAGGFQDLQRVPDRIESVLGRQGRELSSREFGDLLFSLVNIARLARIHPDTALAGSVKKFEQRFKKMEELIAESKRGFEDLSSNEKTLIWKKIENIIS